MVSLKKETMTLFDWCLHNGERGRQLRLEYKYRNKYGKPVDIRKISYDSDKVLNWQCVYGHTWEDSVINRIVGFDCPECEKKYVEEIINGHKMTYGEVFNHTYGTSYAEQFLFYGLKQIYPSAGNRVKAFRDQYRCGLEYDIIIPSEDKNYKAVFIEYSSTYWHKDKEKSDERKARACRNNNVRFIEVIDDVENKYQETWYDNLIVLHMDYNKQQSILVKILSHIFKTLNHSISEIDLNKAFKDAWRYSHGIIPYIKSVAYSYPELAKEWNYKVNGRERPDQYSCGSGTFTTSWKCPHCGREFRVKIGSRIYGKSSCARCGFSWNRLANGEPQVFREAYLKEIRNRERLRLEREKFNREHEVNNNVPENDA